MSTLQTTHRRIPNVRTRLSTGLTALAVLVAIAVAVGTILVLHGGVRPTTTAPSIGSADGNSAAYAPPHFYYGAPMSTPASGAGGLTVNNQGSAAYTKAQLYNTAR
jgi:hypothetical protein